MAALASQTWGMSNGGVKTERIRNSALISPTRACSLAMHLTKELIQGFPRHLSQHVGGFVITKGRLDEVVPVENAAMEDRTVIEWDKDDLDALGILKIDVLSARYAELHSQGLRSAAAASRAELRSRDRAAGG